MTRKQAIDKRDILLGRLTNLGEILRGSLFERTIHHSSGCPKCARGEGHPLWVLNVGYPGGKTRQLSLRPDQISQVREALDRYRQVKDTLEAISELNQQLLRLDRDESRVKESDSDRHTPAATELCRTDSSPKPSAIFGSPGCVMPISRGKTKRCC